MKKLILFDSLSGKKRRFVSLEKGKVSMYTCGPTVYDRSHLGNLRAYVFADILRRTLEFEGYRVRQVVNITDVGHLTSDADDGEDKMELSASKKKKSAWEIAELYTKKFQTDIEILNIQEPVIWSRATDYIEEQIELVKKLEKKGYTYTVSDGVYFDTSKLRDYGKLARLEKQKLKAGARVAFSSGKKNIYDFALWKFSPPASKRYMEWESPWGKGFPGWHIECSAMAIHHLGETIDIHTGGVDHIPIHHSNEIAQSESATGKKFVRYWIHCAHISVEGRKISKSLGNVFTIDDLVSREYEPLVFRYLLLTAHYRTPMSFSWSSLDGAARTFEKIKEHSQELLSEVGNKKKDPKIKNMILEIVGDDLDTPKLIAKIWEILKSKKPSQFKLDFILQADEILGLDLSNPRVYHKVEIKDISQEIKNLLEERGRLRDKKKWKEADKIRDEIKNKGYILEDAPGETVIKKRVN